MNCRLSRFLAGLNFLQQLLDLQSRCGQATVTRSQQPGIDAAIMLDGADTICRQAKRNGFAQNFRWEGAHLQIRHPATTGFVVSVANIVTGLGFLTAYRTYTCHDYFRATPGLQIRVGLIKLSAEPSNS